MAVIERSLVGFRLVFLFAVMSLQGYSDKPADLRAELGTVASALTARNPADALEPFSKSLAHYSQLRDDFKGLTDAFNIVNEIDVLDEQDTAAESKATIRWTITLTGPQTNDTERRSAEIAVRLVRENGKWKIAGFAPIEIFDPAHAPASPTR